MRLGLEIQVIGCKSRVKSKSQSPSHKSSLKSESSSLKSSLKSQNYRLESTWVSSHRLESYSSARCFDCGSCSDQIWQLVGGTSNGIIIIISRLVIVTPPYGLWPMNVSSSEDTMPQVPVDGQLPDGDKLSRLLYMELPHLCALLLLGSSHPTYFCNLFDIGLLDITAKETMYVL